LVAIDTAPDEEALLAKVKILNEKLWDGRLKSHDIEAWLSGFARGGRGSRGRLTGLYLLSQFLYFNERAMRHLLVALYRDLFRLPALQEIKGNLGGSVDLPVLKQEYEGYLAETRFLGIGNPSESGTHLLYSFRQENELPASLFVASHELLYDDVASSGKRPVRRAVFIDDFCGSGAQAIRYSGSLLKALKQGASAPLVFYFPVFASEKGLEVVRQKTMFDRVETLCRLDDSFQVFGPESRYFRGVSCPVSRDEALEVCADLGRTLEPCHPLGFRDSQLLLGFSHNIPNNTLPVLWSHGEAESEWVPVFPRRKKVQKLGRD
jgi:hypothetical protein